MSHLCVNSYNHDLLVGADGTERDSTSVIQVHIFAIILIQKDPVLIQIFVTATGHYDRIPEVPFVQTNDPKNHIAEMLNGPSVTVSVQKRLENDRLLRTSNIIVCKRAPHLCFRLPFYVRFVTAAAADISSMSFNRICP